MGHRQKTWVYVDGFNLYYGCLKKTPYRWLDLRALCRTLLPFDRNRVDRIKYFTAQVTERASKGEATRQQAYLRALATLPEVRIYLGHFLAHEVMLPLADSLAPGQKRRYVKVLRTDEKGSDVNLATHLLCDAYENMFDVAVIISNDSDLLAPLRVVTERLGKPVGVINPHKNPSFQLLHAASFFKSIRPGGLKVSQFPDELEDATGKFSKPAEW